VEAAVYGRKTAEEALAGAGANTQMELDLVLRG